MAKSTKKAAKAAPTKHVGTDVNTLFNNYYDDYTRLHGTDGVMKRAEFEAELAENGSVEFNDKEYSLS